MRRDNKLVVTIIIIIILAGITLNLTLNNNGLLYRAQETSKKTESSKAQEELQLAITDLNIENLQKNETPFLDYLIDYEEYLQVKLNTTELHIDRENKKILYKGRLFTVNESGLLSLEEKGIALSTNSLYMQVMDETKEEKTIQAIPINIEGNINWQSSDESIAKVKNGTIMPEKEGIATITASCNDGTEYRASCTVNVEAFVDDSYIQYDVEYDDVYSGKRFTKNTGWRLITKEQNDDETYNIEFISTGIPCKLCYGWYEINGANWKPTVAEKNEYFNKFYNSSSNGNAAYASAGLYYHFEKIIFKKSLTDSNRNMGGYRKIIKRNNDMIKEEASGDITGDFFINREGATVRNVTLSDVRGYDKIQGVANNVTAYNSENETADKRKGLYKLNDYTPDRSASKMYFVANPTSVTNFYHLLIIVSAGTNNSSNGSRIAGLRPIIKVKNVKLEKDGAVWKIISS